MLECGLIVDGTGNDPISKGVIVIEDDKIKEVGKRNKVKIPNGAEVINLSDQTVLPGLIDEHHHTHAEDAAHSSIRQGTPGYPNVATGIGKALWAVQELKRELNAATTTIRLLGSHYDLDFYLRRAIEDGIIGGPRILTAGKAVKSSSGHGYAGTPFCGVEEVRAAIRNNFANGAECTKLFINDLPYEFLVPPPIRYYSLEERRDPQWLNYGDAPKLSREEINVAIEETHRVGYKIAAHVSGGIGATWFIEDGGDSVEHGGKLSDEQLELMKEKGTWLGMTLRGCVGRPVSRRMNNPKIKPYYMEKRRKTLELYKKIPKLGINWCLHTDTMPGGLMPWTVEHASIDLEISPMEAIIAATRKSAEACGILGERGTLEPGKDADLFSVKGNPLENISTIKNIEVVMVGGKQWDSVSGFWKGEEPRGSVIPEWAR